ncbi:EAL domain-containing protein [Thiohalocapsa marina]|uniref:EAL domain-containing protein n=1 Tax=Thiohalocapsa marina TaxID=424902 RepID=A0A5M8FSA7_9GAMM|nr:EAL domain-containing protein [Thiohalocapsa marina]KAA6186335.1 EAL domain-containing protein [Thiohalocapsa marina]
MAVSPIVEVLCLGVDAAGLGVGEQPQLANEELAFTVATDRPAVHQAFSRSGRWDIILCSAAAFYDLAVDYWLQDDDDGERVASLILVRGPGSQLAPAEAAARGAADLVTHGDREHLAMVMARELAVARLRRRLDEQPATPGQAALLLPRIIDYERPAPISRGAAAAETEAALQIPQLAATAGEITDRHVKALIEHGGLTLEFQAIVPLRQRHDLRAPDAGMFEALLRLRDEQGRLLPPGRFFPAATRHQWLGRLDLWVFRRALSVLAGVQAASGEMPRLFLNLSAETLHAREVGDAVIAAVADARIGYGSLVVEVQRDTLMQDPPALRRLAKTLKANGHGLLLEQFGSADCGLLSAQKDHLTHVKLAAALVQGGDRALLRSDDIRQCVRCARNHGVQVIALAVDDPAMLPGLHALGVDYVQGHLFGLPSEKLVYPALVRTELGPPQGPTRGSSQPG